MPLLRFDVARPEAQGSEIEKRYCSLSHIPVLNDQGDVEVVLQHPIDVTDMERLKEAVPDRNDLALRP